MGSMGNSKKPKNLNEDTPFDELSVVIENIPDPIDLKSKLRQFEAKRTAKRDPIYGTAVISDLREKILTKAVLKNLSPEGVSFEILPIELKVGEDVYVLFSGATNIGQVRSTVQWLTPIEGHRKKHKLIGLQFKNMTQIKKKMLIEFLNKVQNKKQHDPFYGG